MALEIPFTIYRLKNRSGEFLVGFSIFENGSNLTPPSPYPYTPHQGIFFGCRLLNVFN